MASRIVASLMMAAILFTGRQVRAQSAQELIGDLRTRYDQMQSLQASFEQTTTSAFLDESEHYSGEITLSEDAYRIEMNSQTIVSDAVTTWVFNRTENQVIVSNAEEDEESFLLTRFLQEFDTAYTVQSFTDHGNTADITLVPDDPYSFFTSISMHVTREDTLARRLLVTDVNDVQMDFVLSDIVFNPEVSDKLFAFEIPAGAEEIDLRDSQSP